MPTLRILTWNVRAFGDHSIHSDIMRTGAIIRRSRADIVCIQGLRVDATDVGGIGDPPPAAARAIIRELTRYLRLSDAGADWRGAGSGVNADISDPSRGFYAFFWKSSPSGSKEAHDQPLDAVTGLGAPVVLRQFPDDNFPGRRPAMLAVVVDSGESAALLNVVSYHASGMKSGRGINALATLPEVGGGLWSKSGEYQPDGPYGLPEVDTVVVGDFKASMDYPRVELTYHNLLTNYQACVSTPTACIYTHYVASSTQGLTLSDAPDNIFVLRDHGGFTSAFTFDPARPAAVEDFIADVPPGYGRPVAVCPATADHGWGITYQDASGQQRFRRAVSNHLPVWCDLSVNQDGDEAAALEPTRTGYNALLHAVMGTLDHGTYVDAQASSHRQRIVEVLRDQQEEEEEERSAFFPPELSAEDVIALEPEPGTDVVEEELGVDVVGGNSIDVGDAVLRAMQVTFSREPDAAAMLEAVRENRQAKRGVIDPFIDPEYAQRFNRLYDRYVTGICSGRPFNLEEVLLVSEVLGVEVTLWTLLNDQYLWTRFTPSLSVLPDPNHIVSVSIFGDGWHFYRVRDQ